MFGEVVLIMGDIILKVGYDKKSYFGSLYIFQHADNTQSIQKEKIEKEQKFYQGSDYNLSAFEIEEDSLPNVPALEPDYDFDMSSGVYTDQLDFASSNVIFLNLDQKYSTLIYVNIIFILLYYNALKRNSYGNNLC